MAINENNSLKVRHVAYCGASGAGKAIAVKNMKLIGNCVALFDIYGDYKAHRIKALSGLGGRKVYHYTTWATFTRAFIEAWSTGKPFAVAYQPKVIGEKYRAEALRFGQLMWDAADGKRELHIVWEEMAKYMLTTGKEQSVIGELATGGRKFGIVNHFVFQRPVEIPKTIITQCETLVVGAQQAKIDAKFWCEEIDCTMAEIIELGEKNRQFERRKHYLVKSGGIGNYTPKTINF